VPLITAFTVTPTLPNAFLRGLVIGSVYHLTRVHPPSIISGAYSIYQQSPDAFHSCGFLMLPNHIPFSDTASGSAILAVLQDQVREFDHTCSGDEILTKLLGLTVIVLSAISDTVSGDVSLVDLDT
jgi:hypothetical protein